MSLASPMNTPEIIQAITPLIDAFEHFGISYYIGGSVASSVHGKRRATQDVDIVADLQRQHIQPLVKLLEQAYYIDADMIRGAIQHQSTFNVYHNETGVKVDIFVLKSSPIARQELLRAREEVIGIGSCR
jgi:hypothetical protein